MTDLVKMTSPNGPCFIGCFDIISHKGMLGIRVQEEEGLFRQALKDRTQEYTRTKGS